MLDPIFHAGSHYSGLEGQNPLTQHSSHAGFHAAFDGAQDTVGVLCCKNTFDLMGALLVKSGILIKMCLSLLFSASSLICIYVHIQVYMYADICIFLKYKFA